MTCAVIKGPSFEEAAGQIKNLPSNVDMLEFRLDYFKNIDVIGVEKLSKIRYLPVILTLRSEIPNSIYLDNHDKWLDGIKNYLRINPSYIDIESHFEPDFIRTFKKSFPDRKILLSYHNYDETPENLSEIYQQMQKTPADLYKLAVMNKNCIDTARTLLFTKNAVKPVCVTGMGESGEVTRILGKIYGSSFTYASCSDEAGVVSGQLSVKSLEEIYQYSKLNKETRIYGLIGDPVSSSLSHITHNIVFRNFSLPAVYVKIRVKKEELKEFLSYAHRLGFKGLSVTMPLKEELLKYARSIDENAKRIGAANTICFEDDGAHVYNTDQTGALRALENKTDVKNKKILVIGSGGAAKAFIASAADQGACITVLIRDVSKGKELSKSLPILVDSLQNIKYHIDKGYDILINCTPHEMPFDPSLLLPEKIVMDFKTNPKDTELLKASIKKNCRVVYGYEMFVEQALEQFKLWFPGKIDMDLARRTLVDHCLKLLLDK